MNACRPRLHKGADQWSIVIILSAARHFAPSHWRGKGIRETKALRMQVVEQKGHARAACRRGMSKNDKDARSRNANDPQHDKEDFNKTEREGETTRTRKRRAGAYTHTLARRSGGGFELAFQV